MPLSPVQQLKVLRRSQRLCGLFMYFCPVAALNGMGEGAENGRKRVVMPFPTTERYLENDPLPPFRELPGSGELFPPLKPSNPQRKPIK